MFHSKVVDAVVEAERFLSIAKNYLEMCELGEWRKDGYCKESAAVKRASMDLTRTLADSRRSQ